MPPHAELGTKLLMTPTPAFFAPTERVRLEQSAGRIAAEMVSPCPPGIPRILPHGRITEAHVVFFREGRALGHASDMMC